MSGSVFQESEVFLERILEESSEVLESQSFSENSFIGRFMSTSNFSSSLSMDLLNDTILVKNVMQDNTEIAENKEFEKRLGFSVALTTAKASLVEENKKSKNSFEIMTHNVFARPRKFYCKGCFKDVTSQISFKPFEPNFVKNLYQIFRYGTCCRQANETPEILHKCPACLAVLAKITGV